MFHDHKYEDLLVYNEEPRSTSPSSLELQEVDQIKKKKEKEVLSHEPSFIGGYLQMSERNIHEALRILNETKSLVSNSCWKVSSLEEPSFLEDMEKIQREICNIKVNFMSLFFDRKKLVEINEWLHES